jgi:DNA polymerase elongation subunit (family B)
LFDLKALLGLKTGSQSDAQHQQAPGTNNFAVRKPQQFHSETLGEFRERCCIAKDEQAQNKHRFTAKFPPSLADEFGVGFLKKSHSICSYFQDKILITKRLFPQ